MNSSECGTFARALRFSMLALLLAVVPAIAQKGGGPGGPGGGGGGGHEETGTNNLSYPAAITAGLANATLIWAPPVGGGMLGVHYSYGCEMPDGDYPNTSCVGPDGAYLDGAACSAMCGGAPVSRMYWQKVADNDWWAVTTPITPSFEATHVDWGDNLEVVSWRETSVVRVETTPYATLATPQTGLQMWHVFGQGPDEQWGVRATDSSSPQPWIYTTAYPSIYTTGARLDVTKLGMGASTCPTAPGGSSNLFPVWNAATQSWEDTQVAEILDVPFTAELNVGGKYVHGYNLMLKRVVMPGGWSKAGWWRLTFYAPGAVTFSPTAVTTAPPVSIPEPPVSVLAEEEGSLYVPVVDPTNQLTYIDICVVSKKVAGGR